MLTESWPLDHDPVLPARWRPGSSPRPIVVYLDQWCYTHLAHDRAEKPKQPDERGCFDYFRELALAGKVVFVLSEMHYQENWPRIDTDGRWDTAVAMGELTGFNTISMAGVAQWDALVAVAAFTGLTVQIPTPPVFGWGHGHCLPGRKGTVVLGDPRSGKRVTADDLPDMDPAELDDLLRRAAQWIEFAVLARRDPRLEPAMPAFAPVPDNGASARFLNLERGIRDEIDRRGRTKTAVRHLVEFLCFFDEVNLRQVAAACRRLGLPDDTVIEMMAAHPAVADRRRAISEFLAAMPIYGRYCELRVQAHQPAERKFKLSDGHDYFAIAAVSPFVDYLVTDRSMFSLAAETNLDQRGGAVILRKLADLRHRLQLDLSPSGQSGAR